MKKIIIFTLMLIITSFSATAGELYNGNYSCSDDITAYPSSGDGHILLYEDCEGSGSMDGTNFIGSLNATTWTVRGGFEQWDYISGMCRSEGSGDDATVYADFADQTGSTTIYFTQKPESAPTTTNNFLTIKDGGEHYLEFPDRGSPPAIHFDGGSIGKNVVYNQPMNYKIVFIDDTTYEVYVDGVKYHDSGSAGSSLNELRFEGGYTGLHEYEIDNLLVIQGHVNCTPEVSVPPTIVTTNCTSNPDGDITEPYNSTGDITPTFEITLDISSTCGISNTNDSFTDGTTGTTSIVTLPFDKTISCGSGQYVYFNCTANELSTYNKSEVWACDATASGGDTLVVKQSAQIVNFTNTELVHNRTISLCNFHTISKSCDIPALAGWDLIAGTDPLNVAPQSCNTSIYQNVTFRPMYDDIINLAPVTLCGNVSNSVNIPNLIDPPHAFAKDGIVDCSWNTTIDVDMDINYTLQLFNPGTFTVNAKLTIDNFEKIDTLCKVKIYDGGEITN